MNWMWDVINCEGLKVVDENIQQIVLMEEGLKRFTTKEDLMLLSLKHNFPFSTWKSISELIFAEHNILISETQCQHRYQDFLQEADPHSFYTTASNYLGRGLGEQQQPFNFHFDFSDQLLRKPEQFIFIYKQLKTRNQIEEEQTEAFERQHEEMQSLKQILFGEANYQLRRKTWNKSKKTQTKYAQDQIKIMVQCIYSQVRDRKLKSNFRKNEKIEFMLNQILEELLIEIAEKVNRKLKQENQHLNISCEIIQNVIETIDLIRKNNLKYEMVQILNIEFVQEHDSTSCLKIKNIFNQIHLQYSYRCQIRETIPQRKISCSQIQSEEQVEDCLIDEQVEDCPIDKQVEDCLIDEHETMTLTQKILMPLYQLNEEILPFEQDYFCQDLSNSFQQICKQQAFNMIEKMEVQTATHSSSQSQDETIHSTYQQIILPNNLISCQKPSNKFDVSCCAQFSLAISPNYNFEQVICPVVAGCEMEQILKTEETKIEEKETEIELKIEEGQVKEYRRVVLRKKRKSMKGFGTVWINILD